ncbi:MAG: PAS domain S-box protein [Terriglobales bacterium]
MSQISQAILRAQTREELFARVCQMAVKSGYFKVAWIGWLEPSSNLLVPVAMAGDTAGVITPESVSYGGGGITALQSGQACIVDKTPGAPSTPGWRDLAETLGLGCLATYPIRVDNQPRGVFTVGTAAASSLEYTESGLLEGLASDLSFALGSFEIQRQRQQTLKALMAHEQHLQTVLERALDGFYFVDTRGRLVEVNDAYCLMSGYAREELLTMRIADLEIAENEQDVAAHMQRIMRQGMDRFESCHRRKDGQIINIETSVKFHDFDGGRFFCFLRDITERKRAERALRESEERFRLVVEGAPVGIMVQSDGIYRYLNPAALAMFGAETADQIVGHAVAERIHPENRAAVDERIRLLKEERRTAPFLEEQLFRLDGTIFDVEATAIPFVFEGHDGSLAFIRDITERKREEMKRSMLEQQLRQAQKLEAVGRLAGGIAHDFNNILMVIESYTEILQDSLPPHNTFRNSTREILKAAERATSLTGQMLAFSRKQMISPVVLNLNEVIHETSKMLRRLIGEDIEFRIDAQESLWAIEADPDQVVQVVMNLCVNSRDAMPQGGTLVITTGNVTVKEGCTGARPYVAAGDYVKLSVADTGTGIGKSVQEQIFEPFFTTKEVGKGTGLGLAMVYGIVHQSGGYVWVESELGHGACFTIYLPRKDGTVAINAPTNTEPRPRGTETLLVAEDEPSLRQVIVEYMCSLGYAVLAADSGQQALSVAAQHAENIDLLITDVVMPKMSGRELSQTLGRLRPGLKTIFMSGYTDDAILRHGLHDPSAAFLPKPLRLGTLARKVREMLKCD